MEFLIPNTWLPALFLSKNYLPDRTWIIVGSSSLHCFPPSSTLSPKITVLFAVSPHLCQVCQASFYRKIGIFFLNRHHYSKVIIWNNLLHFHNAPIFFVKILQRLNWGSCCQITILCYAIVNLLFVINDFNPLEGFLRNICRFEKCFMSCTWLLTKYIVWIE